MPVGSTLSEVTEFLTDVVGDYGLYAVFALMLVDAVLPAGSEPVMLYGGALASGGVLAHDVVLFGYELPHGFWAYLGIALAGTVGYVLGSIGGWAIGLYGGRPLVERHGRWLHLDARKLERADGWFARYGDAFVFFGRILPLVRSFVAIPAGIGRMALGPYTAYTIPGSAIWCFGLAGIGWALGASWESFHDAFRYADYAVIAGIVLLAALVVLRWRSARLTRRAAGMSDP